MSPQRTCFMPHSGFFFRLKKLWGKLITSTVLVELLDIDLRGIITFWFSSSWEITFQRPSPLWYLKYFSQILDLRETRIGVIRSLEASYLMWITGTDFQLGAQRGDHGFVIWYNCNYTTLQVRIISVWFQTACRSSNRNYTVTPQWAAYNRLQCESMWKHPPTAKICEVNPIVKLWKMKSTQSDNSRHKSGPTGHAERHNKKASCCSGMCLRNDAAEV